MVNKIISKGKAIFTNPQNSVLSAATLIMVMILASRVLGLIRQRALAHFFTAGDLSIFFAAFRLPDTVFEVLVFGTFSSAFIPVFAKLAKKEEKDAWLLASEITNIGLLVFTVLALIVAFSAKNLYQIVAPGYSPLEQAKIVSLTKILFMAQGFFVVSYVLTGVLESLRRFILPALAPIFYNLGIIIMTVLFSSKLGLYAPVLGVFLGAFLHFAIQLPLAMKLGFRFKFKINIDDNVKKIGRLAAPRVLEVAFLQIAKTVELYFSSIITVASYTYFTFGNTLQLLPVGLFGTSIAKAALPTLSRLSDDMEAFSKALFRSLFQMTFLITPLATFLIVLRIPIVRLVFGTDIFTWESTVQTSMVVSAFAFGVISQAAAALLARGFYALHNTKTPVIVSISTITLTILLDYIFIRVLHFPVWGLAAAFSTGSIIQALTLYYLLNRKIHNGRFKLSTVNPFLKHIVASLASGFVMYFILKFFDQSVWVKRLSFMRAIDITRNIQFQKFVLDTRYTGNLLILTGIVSLVGIVIYLLVSIILRTKEVSTYFNLLKRILIKREVGRISEKEKESIIPQVGETGN
jgi:putative peptidoglycan lipid II flippase